MSTNVNAHDLRKFITTNLKIRELSKNDAKKLDIDGKKFDIADTDFDEKLSVDEILDDKDLYAQFATMYVEEQKKEAEAKDKEKEKEEQRKVQDKSQPKA